MERLMTALQTGENYYIEFKETVTSNNELSKEAVALVNGEGGIIYFGISDNGDVIGIKKEAGIEEKVMNILRNNCYPALDGEVKWILYKDKNILQLELFKGKYKPYSTKDGDFYIRVGSTKRKASKEELSRFLQSSGYFQFDSTPIEHGVMEDLEMGRIAEYFKKNYKLDINEKSDVPSIETLLVNSKILIKVKEKICPSVGGLLVFGEKPQELMFNSGIIFARVDGNEIFDNLIDSKQLEGRLPDLIAQCLTLFRLYNTKSSSFVGAERIDNEQYVERVFRELIVNAICHRNYSITGSRVRVLMLNDRYEIRSPGRLPNTITVDNVKTGTSFLRNQLIFKFLNHYGYIENLGRGIPMCMKDTLEHSQRQLEIAEEGEEFVVKVYAKKIGK